MCFSSQYYMMMTVQARPRRPSHFHATRVATRSEPAALTETSRIAQVNGIMMFIFGMQMMVQAQYNVFGDQMMPFIFGADSVS